MFDNPLSDPSPEALTDDQLSAVAGGRAPGSGAAPVAVDAVGNVITDVVESAETAREHQANRDYEEEPHTTYLSDGMS